MGTFSYSKIVDDDTLNRLMDIGSRMDVAQWELGDLVNEMSMQAELNNTGFTHNDVCKAFGSVVGIRAKDMRVIADVATVYPQEERDKHPVLTWGHFLRAMGPKWEQNLKWMEDGIDQLGRPASVDAFLASGEGTVDTKEHPADIAKENHKKRMINALNAVSKSVQAGKVDLDQDTSDKVNKLISALISLLGK